jgi:DNA-directed RNA polymerase specialized sigma24 family protein
MQPRQSWNSETTRASLFFKLNATGSTREMAWAKFIATYVPVIRGFTRSLGVRGADCDEVVTEVLGNFFQASPNFVYDAEKGRFRSYLKTCAIRGVAKVAQRRQRMASTDASGIDHADPDAAEVDAAWDRAWERERLQRAVEVIRKRYLANPSSADTFRAFEMNVLFNQPAKAVADSLGITVDKVHRSKCRVSDAIRAELERTPDLLDEDRE